MFQMEMHQTNLGLGALQRGIVMVVFVDASSTAIATSVAAVEVVVSAAEQV